MFFTSLSAKKGRQQNAMKSPAAPSASALPTRKKVWAWDSEGTTKWWDGRPQPALPISRGRPTPSAQARPDPTRPEIPHGNPQRDRAASRRGFHRIFAGQKPTPPGFAQARTGLPQPPVSFAPGVSSAGQAVGTMIPPDRSRRSFLKSSVALAAATPSAAGLARTQPKEGAGPLLAYVGTF